MTACSSQPQNSYTVIGQLTDSTQFESTMYLMDYNTNQNIDTTKAVAGKYKFEGNVDTITYARVVIPQTRYYANLILEPGNIVIEDKAPHIANGTELNDKMYEFNQNEAALMGKLRTKIQDIQQNKELTDEQKNDMISKEYDDAMKSFETSNLEILNQNKDNFISAKALWTLNEIYRENTKKFDSIYNTLSPEFKEFGPLKRTIETNQKVALTAEGKQYIDFTIENGNVDGTKVSLSDYVGKGKMVLVDFWASWCGPCIQEIPTLKAIYKKYGDKVTILSVAVWDKRDATIKAIEEHNTPWAQIVDAGQIPTDIYGISGIPHIMLIGEDGTIINRNIRGAQIEEAIKANL